MKKVLMINADKCTGCRNCELACSFAHGGSFQPRHSSVHAYSWEREGISVPMMCQHCDSAPCVSVCPTKAMHANEANGRIEWDQSLCILCKMCTVACPFGNAVYDASDHKIIKCDMCKGDPECVRFCPNEALAYSEDTIAVRDRKKAFAAKFKAAFKEVI